MQTIHSPEPQAPSPAAPDAAERRDALAIEPLRAEPAGREGVATQPPITRPKPPPSMKAVNPFVRLLLRSPLHGMLSGSLLLLTYTGRKSGKRYTIPVAYSRMGAVVYVFTDHAWCKNLRGGAPVIVEIKRQRYEGTAEAISDDQAVITAAFLAHLREHPGIARSYHIPVDDHKRPDLNAARQVAQYTTLVRIRLATPSR
ncbi:MAG TPA: nitroreductase/quinone reductase family protein [Ktedonobacterales bacterium]|nr:nitroreductase/quinone reductase family protein [Ktedonobacterales bacterium]